MSYLLNDYEAELSLIRSFDGENKSKIDHIENSKNKMRKIREYRLKKSVGAVLN